MRILLTILLSFLLHTVAAQNIAVTEIPSLGKLPVNAIHRIFQDSEGYMWYGTVNGLCRDDGYHVEVFRSDIYTPGLLDNNLIGCIAEDKEGKIWFGTDKGAYVLDKQDYSISPVCDSRVRGAYIYRIDVTSDGNIWVSVMGSTLCFNSDALFLKEFTIVSEEKKRHIVGFCEDRKGNILVTYSDGKIYFLDSEKGCFKPYSTGNSRGHLGMILQDKDEDYYWIATWDDGIVRFNPQASALDSIYLYQPLPLVDDRTSDNCFLYIAQDNHFGYIWGTTSKSIVAYSKDKKGNLQQVSLPNLFPVSNKMLNEVVKDQHGNLWVSAFDQPSFILHFTNDLPTNHAMHSLRREINGNPAIMALVDSGEGTMWISQERTGLCLYNLLNDEVSFFTDFTETRKLPFGAIKIMSESNLKNSAWIVPVSSKVAYRMRRKEMKMELITKIDLSETIPLGVIQTVLESHSGRFLWLGGATELYRYDLMKGQLDTTFKEFGSVTSIIESSNEEYWVATSDKGFYRINKDLSITNYPIMHHFSSVTLTSDNLVWLGSDEGAIYSFNPLNNELIDHSQQCGLKGDMVNQLMADVFNHIWIHTNQKVIEFNPRNKSFKTYQTTDASMLLWRLIPTSMCKGIDGNIYVGGIPGICSFTPSNRLESAAQSVRPLITNIKILGESLIFGKARKNCSLSEIELTNNDRNIEITFSSLNYRLAHKTRYAYRLLGVDKDWIYTENGECTAYYNVLPKGDFIFEVKSTDENGLWSNQVSQLKVRRLPAFYETWWAYTFYFTLLFIGLIFVVLWYSRRVTKKNNELWNDSQEMIKMRQYLNSEIHTPETEDKQLDKLLLDKAVKCVEANLMEPNFDVAALAQEMNMSRSTLTRKLKIITGKTPLEFIRNIKMQHAYHLLANKESSITEVAANLGYFNRKYFTTCFKEEFGMTPSEYQKSVGKGTFVANEGDK